MKIWNMIRVWLAPSIHDHNHYGKSIECRLTERVGEMKPHQRTPREARVTREIKSCSQICSPLRAIDSYRAELRLNSGTIDGRREETGAKVEPSLLNDESICTCEKIACPSSESLV